MSTNQNDFVIDNGTGFAVRTDIQDALQALAGNSSGNSEPSVKYAYQWWADTSANVMKIRNSANDGWIELFQLDGTLTLEDGSNSAPALSFRSDLDTGLFRSGANTLDIATGGISRFQIDSSEITFNESGADTDFRVEGDTSTHLLFLDAGNDRVGIKASSPATPLHVGGTIHTTTNIGIRVTSPSSNLHVHQDDSDKSIAQFTNTATGTGASDGFQIGLSSGEVALLNMKESSSMLFKTADNDAMTIDSSQRVMIGTSAVGRSGAQNLTIGTGSGDQGMTIRSGTTNEGNIYFSDGSSGGTEESRGIIRFDHNTDNMEFYTASSTNFSALRMRIHNTGQVAIGSDAASVSELLTLDSLGATTTMHLISDTESSIIFEDHGGSAIKYKIGTNLGDNNSQLEVRDMTNNAERLRLTSTGNIRIGPQDDFDGTGASDTAMVRVSTSTSEEFVMGLVERGGQVLGLSCRIDGAGSSTTAINFMDGPTLVSVGTVVCNSSSTSYNSGTSDRTLKKNFENWTDTVLTSFKNLNPQKFHYLYEEDTDAKHKGYIAQDLVADFPEAYPKSPETDKYLFNPSGMVVYLMKAIQELEAKVAALEAA